MLSRDGGLASPQPRSQTGRHEEKCDEARFEQHPVRLISGKIARCSHEREKTHEADHKRGAGPKFNTTSNDAAIPIQHSASSMCEPVENHSSVGAYKKRVRPM